MSVRVTERFLPSQEEIGTNEIGTFLLSKPDFDALNGALIDTPKPATPEKPGPSAEVKKPAIIGASPVTNPTLENPVKP